MPYYTKKYNHAREAVAELPKAMGSTIDPPVCTNLIRFINMKVIAEPRREPRTETRVHSANSKGPVEKGNKEWDARKRELRKEEVEKETSKFEI